LKSAEETIGTAVSNRRPATCKEFLLLPKMGRVSVKVKVKGERLPLANDSPAFDRRRFVLDLAAESRAVLRVERAEEFVPDEGVEAEVGAGMFVVFGVEGGGAEEAEAGERLKASGERFYAGVAEGAPEDVEGEIAEESAERHGVGHEKENHEGAEAENFQGMEDEEADGVGGFVPVVKAVEQGIDGRVVDEPVQGVHPEVHGEEHQGAIQEAFPNAAGLQGDEALFPEPPADD